MTGGFDAGPTAPDGPEPLWSERFGQHYHNRNGGSMQARTVFLEGTETHCSQAPRVIEIGFGLGLNFLTTLADARARGVPLDYRGYEFDPQPAALVAGIARNHPGGDTTLWRQLIEHWPIASAQPQRKDVLAALPALLLSAGSQRLTIVFEDAVQVELPRGWASAVYLDGFSPAVNPDVWTEAFVERLASALRPGGWIATYSAAGCVRRALTRAGLHVERRSGLPGKREWLRARRC